MAANYKQEMDRLSKVHFDAAFLPADPRLADAYYWGIKYFLEQAEKTLEPMRCRISLKNFSPQQLPALYVPGDEGLFDSTMDGQNFSSFFEGFDFSNEEESSGARLYLNCTNSLVKRLYILRDPEYIETVIQVMYVQALLAGHYTLGNKEMEMMNKGLIKLMEYGIGGMEA